MKDHILDEKKEFVNVRELIEWAAQEYGEKTAYSYRVSPTKPDITKVSFIKFRNDVRALATEMLDMGCAGKHCVIIGKFSYEWAVTYYATLCIGAVLVPLDRDWLAQDLADTAIRADVRFLFCDEDIAEKAKIIAEQANLDADTIYLNAKNNERNLHALVNEGREKFTIPEETQTGTTFTLKQKGVPMVNSSRRGDLIFRVNVEVPKSLTEKQKELLRAFAEACGENNYTKKKGFFKKDKK
jgi:acyl-CoA synthetase (AMP-forming)/AMP-acid ligase II